MKFIVEPFGNSPVIKGCKTKDTCLFKTCATLLPIICGIY